MLSAESNIKDFLRKRKISENGCWERDEVVGERKETGEGKISECRAGVMRRKGK